MKSRPVAVITGASQGIGAATAKVLAERGYDCLLMARGAEGLEQTAEAVRQSGGTALVCAGDLADLKYAEQSVGAAVEKWGRIDLLVNNAAWRDIVTMKQIGLESWEKTLRICLTAPAFLARWCAVEMEKQSKGVILNISSIQSKFSAGISPAYVASKGGMDALTYELSALYAPAGIRVLSLNLGAIDTEMSADYISEDGQNLSGRLRAAVEDLIPLQRYAQPEEIARTIAMLASDDASYMTGTCLEIDGGWFHQCHPYSLKKEQFPQDFR